MSVFVNKIPEIQISDEELSEPDKIRYSKIHDAAFSYTAENNLDSIAKFSQEKWGDFVDDGGTGALCSFFSICNQYGVSKNSSLSFMYGKIGGDYPEVSKVANYVYNKYSSEFATKVFLKKQNQQSTPQPQPDTHEASNNNIPSDFESLSFSLTKPKEMPKPVVSTPARDIISSAGNITTIAGQVKSGKTALNAAILAGATAPQGSIIDTLGLVIQANSNYKAVLHYDSEQSEYNHFKFFKGVYERTGRSKDVDFFGSWNIRKYDVKNRIVFIEQSANSYAQKHGGVFIIIIDGIADLMNNPNDYEESNIIIDRVEKLAIRYNCPVVTVLHFNPGSDKERGHLGSQLQRKSESVLSIIRDGAQSVLTGKYLRNAGEIPEIRFEYNKEKGYHTLANIITPQIKQQAKEQAKEAKTEKKINMLREEFSRLFYNNKPLQYTVLSDSYKTMTGCSTPTANRAVTAAKELGILSMDVSGLYILNK